MRPEENENEGHDVISHAAFGDLGFLRADSFASRTPSTETFRALVLVPHLVHEPPSVRDATLPW